MYKKYGVAKTNRQIMSIGRYNTIEEETIEQIESLQGHIGTFLKYVTVHDNVYDPDKIYSIVQSYLHKNGEIKMKKTKQLVDGVWQEVSVPDRYEPVDPEQYVLVVLDHIGLMYQKGKRTKQTIEYWSSNLALKLRDIYGCTIINVQQQAADQESVDNFKAGKLEPSLKGLAESKLTQRDANIVLGLYSPNRHGKLSYLGYDISTLKDNFRSLIILKDRDGSSDVRLPLYFDGRIDYFHELPKDPNKMERIYEEYKSKHETYDKLQENIKNLLTYDS